ncbi:conserved hypothetical protein (plasmid) [Sinorhizobium fredii NGR234]|uniref:1,4-alpha-glucan branching enzyme n=1 Tax=Sinorhizobium fredii (strain NBRC 101917 / NGR234) TaxID=394 RepID=C3KR49_SINFN|nr:hypothetical protein [Sinorhizobium fredii]ACP22557.1 conserved hypothetical protein [Sinorhizobium fredii NGR234]
MSASKTTTDHDTIRKWAEGRDGHPARVKGASDGGLLRIDFGKPEQRLEEISWEEFFKIFDENKLTFLYQDRLEGGKVSRFFKFIDRE